MHTTADRGAGAHALRARLYPFRYPDADSRGSAVVHVLPCVALQCAGFDVQEQPQQKGRRQSGKASAGNLSVRMSVLVLVPVDFADVQRHRQLQHHFAGQLRDVQYVAPTPARPACCSARAWSRTSACLHACMHALAMYMTQRFCTRHCIAALLPPLLPPLPQSQGQERVAGVEGAEVQPAQEAFVRATPGAIVDSSASHRRGHGQAAGVHHAAQHGAHAQSQG